MGGVWAHLADRLPPRSPSLWSPGFPRLDVASQGHGQCVGCSVTRFNGAFAYEEDGACKRPYWLPVLCTWGAHTPSLGVQNGAGGSLPNVELPPECGSGRQTPRFSRLMLPAPGPPRACSQPGPCLSGKGSLSVSQTFSFC